MFSNRRQSAGALLIAGIAAYAYYRFSKMSPEKKEQFVGDLKDKGRRLRDQFLPSRPGSSFTDAGRSTFNSRFAEENNYTG